MPRGRGSLAKHSRSRSQFPVRNLGRLVPTTSGFLEGQTMRNAAGLMLASVVSAVVVAAIWFWTASPRVDVAAPGTVSAREAGRRPVTGSAPPVPPREEVEV